MAKETTGLYYGARADAKLRAYGTVDADTIRWLNKEIQQKAAALSEEADVLRETMRADTATQERKTRFLEQEGIWKPDGIPAYAADAAVDGPNRDAEIMALSNRWDTLYQQVSLYDGYLTEETRKMLGADYAAYQEHHADKKQEFSSHTMQTKERSLPDGYTNVYDPEDDWSFDEADDAPEFSGV